MPAPPDRPARLPRDAKLALGRADRRAGVIGRLAVEPDGLTELGRLLRLAQFDEELGPLVLLHPEAALAMRGHSSRNAIVAGEPIFGRGEAAGERAVAVGLDVEPLDLLVVRVAQDDLHVAARDDLVIILGLIPREGDALELNRLAGPINCAVGEKHHRLPGLGHLHGAPPVAVLPGRADPPAVVLREEITVILVFGFLKTEHPRLIRGAGFFRVFATIVSQP